MGCNGLPTTGIQGTIITGTLEVGSKLPHFHADVRISDDITGGTKVTIKTADLDAFTIGPRHVVINPQAYTNGSRFNDTFNLPYWATTNTNASHLYCYCSKKKEEQRNKKAGRKKKQQCCSSNVAWLFLYVYVQRAEPLFKIKMKVDSLASIRSVHHCANQHSMMLFCTCSIINL